MSKAVPKRAGAANGAHPRNAINRPLAVAAIVPTATGAIVPGGDNKK
jgi:hypothetical protein